MSLLPDTEFDFITSLKQLTHCPSTGVDLQSTLSLVLQGWTFWDYVNHHIRSGAASVLRASTAGSLGNTKKGISLSLPTMAYY